MRKGVVADREARSDRPKGGHLALAGGQNRGSAVPRESETVAVTGLRKAYGAVRAVDDVSFTVARGEIFALLGPNGAGKTTTIEILEGFRGRDAGQVRVLGVDPGDRRTQRWLRSRMGVVLQELAVEPFLPCAGARRATPASTRRRARSRRSSTWSDWPARPTPA